MPAAYKVGDRVKVAIEGKGWVGPASEQLHGRAGTVTKVDEQSAHAEVFGFGHFVTFDVPLELGWRTIDGLWFIEDYLEPAS